MASGERALLVAEDEEWVCGTVQLVLEQPDNQPHRADLAKISCTAGRGGAASELFDARGR